MTKVTNPKKVDIIIPIYNRPEHTRQTLDSLIANTNPDLYNLYLVDDCSTDPEISRMLVRLGYNFPLFKNEKNIGPGASRNWMCNWITEHELRSKYLYHSDNDVYFTGGWLDILIESFEVFNGMGMYAGKIKLLGGGCHPYLQNNDRYGGFIEERRVDIGTKDAVSGYSQLMTWETWDKYGPFDETMRDAEKKIMGSEDWAFCQKIVKDGFTVASIEPEVVIATGKTNTYNEPATGSETFKEVQGVKII